MKDLSFFFFFWTRLEPLLYSNYGPMLNDHSVMKQEKTNLPLNYVMCLQVFVRTAVSVFLSVSKQGGGGMCIVAGVWLEV